MAIQLSKGQRIDLTKDNPSLKKIRVALGWDTNSFDSNFEYDLDASAFLLNASGKCTRDLDFVFYNNLTAPGITHTGDNRTGDADIDDEQLIVNFDEISSDIEKVAFVVTIHDAEQRSQNFGQVHNAYVRLINDETNEELLRYDLGEDFSIETAILFCEIYRHNNDWKFNAVGAGYQGGLASFVTSYGLSV